MDLQWRLSFVHSALADSLVHGTLFAHEKPRSVQHEKSKLPRTVKVTNSDVLENIGLDESPDNNLGHR